MQNVIGSREAASILGIDRGTFNRWAAKGDIPIAYKVTGATGSRLFNREDIEELAKARANSAAQLGFDDDAKQPA